jgi:NAD(P)-dependent dehydrogenase (short-subunit alcohol dehydrogenase family)
VKLVAEHHGRLDAVVALSGSTRAGELEDGPGEAWERVIAIGLNACVF